MVSRKKLLQTEIIIGTSIAGVVLLIFAVALAIRFCSNGDEVRYVPIPEAESSVQ